MAKRHLDDFPPNSLALLARAHELLDELLNTCEAADDWTDYDAVFEWIELHTPSAN